MSEPDHPRSPAQDPAAVALREKFSRGAALHRQGKIADAERICREILLQRPDHFDALHLLGVIAHQTGHGDQAIEIFESAIVLKPDSAEAYNNRGIALNDLNRPADALASYDKAIALKPDFAEAYGNRGIALNDLNRPVDALASYDKAIALKPDYAEAYYNRGVALNNLKRPTDALTHYDKAIALKPDYAKAHLSQSLCFLQLGRLEQGWRQFEWRKKGDKPTAARSFRQPLWLGNEDVSGKTLFIWCEQGLGDTVQFCRYVKLVEALGAKVVMSVQQPLRELLKQISPTIQIIDQEEVPVDFDYHCPLLSLPLAFRTTLEAIPAQQPRLKADEKLRQAWAARLPPTIKPRIGLAWSGRTDFPRLKNRSMDLEQLLPILGSDADWICLQKDVAARDLVVLRQFGRIMFFADEVRDFSDTAALIELMDLVITVDTSVAHLAGAMGKPVWIMLRYNPDWRWLLDRDDSPWYPTARLFRQDDSRAWDSVITRVRGALDEFITSR
jgi:tetratricopeptide (TPR) repeat protein